MKKKTTTASPAATALMADLPALSLTDLQHVAARCATLIRALGGSTSKAPTTPAPDGDWMLDGIYSAMRSADRNFQLIPYALVVDTPAYKHYAKFAPGIRAKIEQELPNLRPAEKLILGPMLGDLFLEYVFERAESVSLHSLLYRIEQYTQAIDHSFPGYLESGLLKVLLTSRAQEVMVPTG